MSARLVWGLACVVPVLLGRWNPVVVTVGRYLAYGLVSGCCPFSAAARCGSVTREHWRTALAFAVAWNARYYLLLVAAIRAAGAPLTDMVISAIPVVVAVAGNWLAPAYRWRQLALPLILVTAGLGLGSALEITGIHAY